MKTPTDKISIKLGGNNYETTITIGKIIEVERYKAFYSGGLYSKFNTNLSLDIVDIMSYLTAFFPQIKEDQKIENIMDLSPIQLNEIKKEIVGKFLPWYDKWISIMRDVEKVEPKENKEND